MHTTVADLYKRGGTSQYPTLQPDNVHLQNGSLLGTLAVTVPQWLIISIPLGFLWQLR